MKKYTVFLAILALVLASLACQTIMGGGNNDVPDAQESDDFDSPTPEEDGDTDFSTSGESEFSIPDDAINVINMGDDVLNFQTSLSLEESMDFYRDEFGKSGYTERSELTVSASGTFSMVFDGHASGKAITVQGVDLGDGTVNISITLADL